MKRQTEYRPIGAHSQRGAGFCTGFRRRPGHRDDAAEILPHVELLSVYEGNTFASTGNAVADLLSITAVHPLRDDAVAELLARCQASFDVVDALVTCGHLVITEYNQRTFYLRGYS